MRTLAARLEQTCQFTDGEVDIVLLQHTFEVVRADGKEETITSTLEAYGDRNGGPSAMARLVGVPCAMAVQFVLEGKLTTPGVRQPYDEEVGPDEITLTLDLCHVPRATREGRRYHHGGKDCVACQYRCTTSPHFVGWHA